MNNVAIFVAILTLGLSACAQKPAESRPESNIPAKLDTALPWLQAKIWDYQSRVVSNPPHRVIKTTFEGKPVYYVPPVCCDIPSELYSEDGKLICYPSGGFTGAGDMKCPKFKLEYPDYVKDNKTTIIWKDKRKPADTKSKRVNPNDMPKLQ
jgi:hypothetical protein